jgi:uncharacterized protein YyaL (SSP411 family)
MACLAPGAVTQTAAQPQLSRNVREALLARNQNAFDWVHGGQSGRIKFVDLHQFEFAIKQVQEGNLLARIMVNLYLDGIRRLIIPELGGACQYSVGPRWNNRNRLTTLAGQAVVLQALALGAQLFRSTSALEIGTGVHYFARNRDIGLYPSATVGNGRAPRLTAHPRLRDNAWYSAALHQFACTYENTDLMHEADAIFDATVTAHARADGPMQSNSGTNCALDDTVAVATALTYFGAATANSNLLHQARTLICAGVPRHTCPEGGYRQSFEPHGSADMPLDIDCTIDLARICLSLLKRIPDHGLASIALHGIHALFDPSIALARRPEAGILLVAADAAEIFPPTKFSVGNACAIEA